MPTLHLIFDSTVSVDLIKRRLLFTFSSALSPNIMAGWKNWTQLHNICRHMYSCSNSAFGWNPQELGVSLWLSAMKFVFTVQMPSLFFFHFFFSLCRCLVFVVNCCEIYLFIPHPPPTPTPTPFLSACSELEHDEINQWTILLDQRNSFVGSATQFCWNSKTILWDQQCSFVGSAILFVGSAVQFCWIKHKSLCVQPVSVSKSKKDISFFKWKRKPPTLNHFEQKCSYIIQGPCLSVGWINCVLCVILACV